MVGFYAPFIPDYNRKAAVLHGLKRKGVQFVRRSEHQAAFESLKQALCEAPVLQIPGLGVGFVLVTDVSDLAVSAVLTSAGGWRTSPDLVLQPSVDCSREEVQHLRERVFSFGCEKCRTYLEHKQFELHCDNLALCWLMKLVKEVDSLGRWILRLAPFKFRLKHTRGVDNVVADALSRIFERDSGETHETNCVALLQSLPLVYSSLEEHQKQDPFCVDLRDKIQAGQGGNDNFEMSKGLLCYYPKGARRRRWIVPVSSRPRLLKYFHDSVLKDVWVPLRSSRKSQGIFTGPRCGQKFWTMYIGVAFVRGRNPCRIRVWGYIQQAPFPKLWRGCSQISWARLLARSEVILRSW
jgi:hypothetical protein